MSDKKKGAARPKGTAVRVRRVNVMLPCWVHQSTVIDRIKLGWDSADEYVADILAGIADCGDMFPDCLGERRELPDYRRGPYGKPFGLALTLPATVCERFGRVAGAHGFPTFNSGLAAALNWWAAHAALDDGEGWKGAAS